MAIFFSTFRKLLKWKSTLIFLIIMAILPIILGLVLRNEVYSSDMSFQGQLDFTLGIYCILVFMWVLGIPFLIVNTAKGIGIIADEYSDGTLGLLVTMKISRYKIIFAKWLALFTTMIMLGILVLFENLLIITTISNMDVNIKDFLIQTIPNLIKYLIFISFIFSNMSILLSLLIKSKVFATVNITFLIVIMFLIIPLFKNFLFSYYEDYYLYLLDLNYQFSSIYYYFFSANNIELAPTLQLIVGTFLSIFNTKQIIDIDLNVLLNYPLLNQAPVYYYLNSFKLLLFWIGLSSFTLILSMVILTKRDIT